MKTVLIIEDSATTRQLLRETLEDAGYLTLVAKDGLTAVTIGAEVLADCILCDFHLPDQEGSAVLGRLRDIPGWEKVPAAILTASGRQEIANIEAKLPGVRVVRKPAGGADVVRLVRDLLGG